MLFNWLTLEILYSIQKKIGCESNEILLKRSILLHFNRYLRITQAKFFYPILHILNLTI